MSPNSCQTQVKVVDWKGELSLPKTSGHVRDMDAYPSTVLGELAFRIRELYARDSDHPRPSGAHLAQTSRLVGLLAEEFQGSSLHRCSPAELALVNYLVTPRTLWSDARPLHHAIREIVGERFVRDGGVIAGRLRRAWSGGEGSLEVYYLQQIAIHLFMNDSVYKDIAKVVGSAIPPQRRCAMSQCLTGGAFAMLAMSGQLGERRAHNILLGVGLDALARAETIDTLFGLDPLSRPTEYRFASFFFADLLQAQLGTYQNEVGFQWVPNDNEALDITRSWLEGSHFPVRNFLRHWNALKGDHLAPLFKELYHHNGIRNFRRLELSECEDPWYLVRHLVERDIAATAGRDIILVANGSGDHNDAFSERAWEFEGIRAAGETQGWEFDYVEVRDSVELGYHILRHHQQGSRVAVLHQLGHGSRETAEYGHLERDERSALDLSQLGTRREHQEVCDIASKAVDTWVLHHCSTAAPRSEGSRKVSNLVEALRNATKRKVTITGLRDNDAFDTLIHRRDSRNRVVFTGKPVWMGAQRLR